MWGSGDLEIAEFGDLEIGGLGDLEIGGSGDLEIGGSGDLEIGGLGDLPLQFLRHAVKHSIAETAIPVLPRQAVGGLQGSAIQPFSAHGRSGSHTAGIVHLGLGMDRETMRARTAKFGVDIIKFCRPLFRRDDSRKLAGQLQDAGTSVAANYHAACRGRSRAEFIAKLGVANEESDEAVLWLTMFRDGGVFRGPELDRLLQEATELRAIIARSRSTAVANQNHGKE